MYTSTMRYEFKIDKFAEACEIWENKVLALAAKQPGFVRMQFLVQPDKGIALAIGTWESQIAAQNFMKTGVFKDLLEDLKDFSLSQPQPEIWVLKYYRSLIVPD
ncbi:MAG: antibiotic biosynthesis monooxygenase [Candidatus Cloacimonetes bacterium]|nr:antibiotic biosynthesis monooxygenase [Candidatus Cloacimonadota bacterium]